MADSDKEQGESSKIDIKEGDRVKQVDKPGCQGVVKMLREEVVGSSGVVDEKAIMVKVLWDNGTFSYFAPEAIAKV